MSAEPIELRRARRGDLTALLAVLAGGASAVPAPDRALLRRFRRLVADLGSDLYVACVAARIVGFVHITYARQLAGAPRARIEQLAVEPRAGAAVITRLLDLAAERARQRACDELSFAAPPAPRVQAQLAGWEPQAATFRRRLQPAE